MSFDPSQCRVLSVGKAIAQLEPFLKQHGYVCVGKETGLQAIEVLSEQSFHIVLMELNLRDIELRDFYEEAIKTQKDAAFLIMAPPNLAEDIVSALVAGADGYIAVPPDEDEMFRELKRQGSAALARKAENPDADPGVKKELDSLKEQAAKYREHAENLQKQVAELRESKETAESEAARLRKEAKKAGDGPSVPPGHRVVKDEEYEELESKASFIEFLESENDELKKELEQLRAGAGGGGDEFDESTGAMAAPPAGMLAGGSDEDELLIEDDDDDELVILDDDEDGDALAAAAEAVKAPTPTPKPVPAAAPMPAPAPAATDDEFEENTDALLALVEDSSEEELVIDDPPAKPAAAPKPVPAAAPPPVITPPPPAAAAPPAEADDDFENLNTDALLALTDDSDDGEINDDDLQALLDDLD